MLAHTETAHALTGLASFAAGACFGLIVALATFTPIYVRAAWRKVGAR